jgi:hypothetical protein
MTNLVRLITKGNRDFLEPSPVFGSLKLSAASRVRRSFDASLMRLMGQDVNMSISVTHYNLLPLKDVAPPDPAVK